MSSQSKASLYEFHHQFKDIRSQLFEQIKCLEQRTIDQMAIFQELNDFLRKRAELELQFSKELDKLVKSVMLKHKNEKQKRINWPLYSICNLWQQIIDDAKEEAKQRSISAEVYANNVVPSIASKCVIFQKVSKKCREIGILAQGEVIRVLNELHTALKTYQLCYWEQSSLSTKLQHAEEQRKKTMDTNSSTRRQRSVQKVYHKKSEKYEVAKQKCTRSRNEYLLCIDAANASLYKYFADDLSDLIDCSDLGLDCWLGLILQNIISVRKSACQAEMTSLANLSSFKESLQSHVDKHRFFENNHQVFMLPKRFNFKYEPSESINQISTENLVEEFKQRHHQIKKRLLTLLVESELSWKNMEGMEKQIKDLLYQSTLVEVNEFGISDNRPPLEDLEQETGKLYESYLQTFSFFLLNANLITRLEARADGIAEGLKHGNDNILSSKNYQSSVIEETAMPTADYLTEKPIAFDIGLSANEQNDSSIEWAQRRKRRIGSQASTEHQNSSTWTRPRLFGGSLEEYTESTGEQIPIVVLSCVQVLSQFALQHQGLFRISGSQLEINRMRDAFEIGDDPLKNVKDGNDANSIAGLLKLYLRELREPLFPFYLFDLLTDCAKSISIADFVEKITPLLNKLNKSSYLLLRYLFAFLNHLSEFSDETMMDSYNLAICLGPTLLPIPEGKNQVIHQNSVNEVIKNLIVHFDVVFDARISGPRYEKYNNAFSTVVTPADAEMDIYMMDDDIVDEKKHYIPNFENSLSSFRSREEEKNTEISPEIPIAQNLRLPFLANYKIQQQQQNQQNQVAVDNPICQSMMACNTNSSNFYKPNYNNILEDGTLQYNNISSDIAVADALDKSSKITSSKNENEINYTDFINNYSSSESGLEGLSAINKQFINTETNLLSPLQRQRFTNNQTIQKQPALEVVNDASKTEYLKKFRTENEKTNDLYASIKRNERIRIPTMPKLQTSFNHTEHQLQKTSVSNAGNNSQYTSSAQHIPSLSRKQLATGYSSNFEEHQRQKPESIGFLQKELINNRVELAGEFYQQQHNAPDLHELQMMKIDELIDKLNTTASEEPNNNKN